MATIETSVNSNAEETFVSDYHLSPLKCNLQKYIKTCKKEMIVMFFVVVFMLLVALTLYFKNV